MSYENSHAAQWYRVRQAITARCPEIDCEELAHCETGVDEPQWFVEQHVSGEGGQLATVVGEFSPPESLIERVRSRSRS